MNAIFARVWRRWLHDPFSGKQCTVVRVRGWNACTYDSPGGGRYGVEFLGPPWQKQIEDGP